MVSRDEVMRVIGIGGAALAIALLGALCYKWYTVEQDEKPKVMTQEQVKDRGEVAKEIHVTTPAAQTIVREIERSGSESPAVTYYIQSPTVEKAAETTAKQIQTGDKPLPEKAIEKSDRTIVTADKQLNKVDVYKISLRRAHKLKAGMTYVDDRAYLSTGYQAGKWEGLAHFNQNGFQGATLMYTIKEW